MLFGFRGLVRFSFVLSVMVYAAGVLVAGAVTALGSYRLFSATFSGVAPFEGARAATATKLGAALSPPALQGRQAAMTPLHGFAVLPDRPISQPRLAQPAFFGSSSRYWGRPSRRDPDEDEDEYYEDYRPGYAGTYRTMCVRLCDGYYFPISFSATRDRFDRDARTCDNSCGGQARLFVYPNPGADVEDMVDLQGRPYRQLSTAFRYRSEYVAACRCKPNPWDAEAREQHRMYALAAAARKGNKTAAAELKALTARMKVNDPMPPAKVVAPVQEPGAVSEGREAASAGPPRRRDRVDDRSGRMSLGRQAPQRPLRTWKREPDWMKRALSLNF